MINSITLTNPKGVSNTIELRSPEQSGFFVRNITGLGPPRATINYGEAVYGDGGYYNSSRYNIRNIVMDLGFYNNGSESIESIRNRSYNIFREKEPKKITIATDSKTIFCNGYVESNEPTIFSKDTGTQVSIICPDPFFYSDDTITTIFTGITDLFTFPFENASLVSNLLEMSQLFVNKEATVFYSGDIPTGVLIDILLTGSVSGTLTIYNVTTGESMPITLAALPLQPLAVGDQIQINTTSRGQRWIWHVRNGVAYNALQALDIDTDWFTISYGDNVFKYTATSGVTNMLFNIQHRVVYGGV